ncbi:MAG: YicC family protein [Hyphomicrobiaceae bacterium]|nr:YicC family protein [Hyphomicrobiaceae bacterium]
MGLKSMTGFARAEGQDRGATWAFEGRSVNGRGLDLRFRLPPGHDWLETRARELAQKRLARGSITVSLDLTRPQAVPEIRLNEVALAQVLAAAERVRSVTGAAPISVEGVLGVRGVLEIAEPVENPEAEEARRAGVLVTFEQLLNGLNDSRGREGARLASIMNEYLSEIERLVAVVAASPARQPEAIARRLGEQVQRLTGAAQATLDPQRLHQEAMLLGTKADVEEELQRLRVHLAAARELVAGDAPCGRQLDFLTQEFNREANTLCAKANDPDISRAGLAMKVVIDQMREQVANIE